MKRMVAGLLTLGVCGLMLGGCVSKEEYEKAVAAARRANEQLGKCQSALKDCRTEVQKLTQDVADRDAQLAAKDQQLSLLMRGRDDLKADFDKLKELYEKAAGRAVPGPIGPIAVLPPNLDKALKEFAAAHPDLVEYLPQYGMVKLKADLTFEPGSDTVQAGAKDALAKFVAVINGPDGAKFNIYVAGHTDDIPIEKPDTKRKHPDNWYLSVHRAIAVEQVVAKAGLSQPRIAAMGFSEWHPVAANAAGRKGNRANRRVEIWIVPPDRFLTGRAEAGTGEASGG
jgi:chemotaxis protein MotB